MKDALVSSTHFHRLLTYCALKFVAPTAIHIFRTTAVVLKMSLSLSSFINLKTLYEVCMYFYLWQVELFMKPIQ